MTSTILRNSAALLLAAGTLAFAGTAQAVTVEGVTVPDVDLTAGTGNHTVDITIGAGSPVVGSADELVVSIDRSVVLGVTAAGVGGSCSSWSCEPGSSGWRAGTIQLTVSTAKASPCSGSGVMYNCSRSPLEVQIIGGGTPARVGGSVLITVPAQPAKAPTTAPPKTVPSQPASVNATKQATAKQATSKQATTKRADQATPSASTTPAESSLTASIAAVTPSASMTTSASPGGAAVTATGLPVVADAADTRSALSSRWIYGGVAIVFMLFAAAFALRRRASRKQD